MGHKKGITPSLASRRTPSLFSKGLAGPEYSGERDPKFVKPAPPTRDSGIGQKQLEKHLRQHFLKARNITRSRRT